MLTFILGFVSGILIAGGVVFLLTARLIVGKGPRW